MKIRNIIPLTTWTTSVVSPIINKMTRLFSDGLS